MVTKIYNNSTVCNQRINMHSTLTVIIQILCICLRNNVTHEIQKYYTWAILHMPYDGDSLLPSAMNFKKSIFFTFCVLSSLI